MIVSAGYKPKRLKTRTVTDRLRDEQNTASDDSMAIG
jgi:hypothetical protein